MAAALSSAEAGLKSEEARLDGAKADFLRAQTEYGRNQDLFETKDVSRSELDLSEADFLQARSRLRMGEAAIEIAKATIKQREKNLDNAVITAPIDGTITRLQAEEGETVVVGTMNNPGSLIMEVADLTTISGSLVLALAVLHHRLAAPDAWRLSRIDEDWNVEEWGEDVDAAALAARREADFLHAARVLGLFDH